MRALLRAVMYVVAVVAGLDAYVVGSRYLNEERAMPSGRAMTIAGLAGLVVAVLLATVPIAVYQRTMRRVDAARRTRATTRSSPESVPVPVPAAATPLAASAPVPPGPDSAPPLASVPIGPAPLATTMPVPAAPGSLPLLVSTSPPPSPELAPLWEVIEDCDEKVGEAVRLYGPDHPQTFAARLNLAGAYWGVGQLDRAITLYENVLDDCVRVRGEDDPETLVCSSDLAAAYEMDGRLDEAITLYARTLAIRERTLGSHHPDTTTSRSDLAVAYSIRDNLSRGRRDRQEPDQN